MWSCYSIHNFISWTQITAFLHSLSHFISRFITFNILHPLWVRLKMLLLFMPTLDTIIICTTEMCEKCEIAAKSHTEIETSWAEKMERKAYPVGSFSFITTTRETVAAFWKTERNTRYRAQTHTQHFVHKQNNVCRNAGPQFTILCNHLETKYLFVRLLWWGFR